MQVSLSDILQSRFLPSMPSTNVVQQREDDDLKDGSNGTEVFSKEALNIVHAAPRNIRDAQSTVATSTRSAIASSNASPIALHPAFDVSEDMEKHAWVARAVGLGVHRILSEKEWQHVCSLESEYVSREQLVIYMHKRGVDEKFLRSQLMLTEAMDDMTLVPSLLVSMNASPQVLDVDAKTLKQRKFVYCSVLGKGAFATVFLVQDIESGERFALKKCTIVKTSETQDKQLAELRQLEIAALRSLKRLKGIRENDEQCDILMEYYPGVNLGAAIDMCRSVSVPVALSIIKIVAEQLHDWHEKFVVVHTDIKPANILIGPDGRVTIIDVGVHQMSWSSSQEEDDIWSMRGEKAETVGTPGFADLVQFPNTESSVWNHSSLYSLAQLFVTLLGTPPAKDKKSDIHQMYDNALLQLMGVIRRLKDDGHDIPRQLHNLLIDAVRHPSERPSYDVFLSRLTVIMRQMGASRCIANPDDPPNWQRLAFRETTLTHKNGKELETREIANRLKAL